MEEDIVYSNNPNEDSVQMKIGGKYHKAYLTRSVSEDIMYQDNPNVPKVLFTGSDGKKHTAYLVKGVNSHDLGWYATPEALQTAHPTGDNGDWAMVGSTDTVWIWDADSSSWVDSGNTDSANKNLSNLTDTGKNIANWSSNVSNCITEIPQDIKISVSGNVLTIKAGSKVYVPNGAGTFDTLTLPTDKSITLTQNGIRTISINQQNGNLTLYDIYGSYASDTVPTQKQYMMWYDTINNVIKTTGDYGATWSTDIYSLPFAIVTISGGALTSVDNIFNGFGHFSSLIFALPGVAGLIPNGRNADGSLKSTAFKTTSVLTALTNGTGRLFTINGSAVGALAASNVSYSEVDNILYNSGSAYSGVVWGKADVYTSAMNHYVQTEEPFRVLNYYDTEYIAHQVAPSNRYVSLTLPASGGTITAPADGYIYINKTSGAAGENIRFTNPNIFELNRYANNADETVRMLFPVSKGMSVGVIYTLSGATNSFRFIYANGSK